MNTVTAFALNPKVLDVVLCATEVYKDGALEAPASDIIFLLIMFIVFLKSDSINKNIPWGVTYYKAGFMTY